MHPARIIYEDSPAYIPIPSELRPAPKPRRRPPVALSGKAKDVGDVMSSAPNGECGIDGRDRA